MIMETNWLNDRNASHNRNDSLESLLDEIAMPLSKAEEQYLKNIDLSIPRPPTLMIVGCPRSGTTLLMQQIANSKKFSYPTNFLSRFYTAPILGSRIQKLLFDDRYQFKNELELMPSKELELKSNIGKTSGVLSPHVFWYFWYNNFNFKNSTKLTQSEFQNSRLDTFKKELAGLYDESCKPFALKAMVMNWNLVELFRNNRNILLVRTKRNKFDVANSIFNARIEHSGSPSKWWSFIPPEYEEIKDLPPMIQIAAFVISIEKALDKASQSIPSVNMIELDYKELCSEPNEQLNKICEAYSDLGFTSPLVRGLNSQKQSELTDRGLINNWATAFEQAEALECFKL